MVKGLDKFREAFSAYTDNYVIIGGTACDIALTDTDMVPRATNDIDMILIIENMTEAFANAFWQFIREGGYTPDKRHRQSDGKVIYTLYRFIDPKSGYPIKIELLSRHPEMLGEPSDFHIAPIPTGEEISSLSAIIMNDCYYDFTISNSVVEDGLRVASPIALMALKTRAYLNLMEERRQGRKVNGKDIRKHRSDVMKLIATASLPEPIAVGEEIFSTIRAFVDGIRADLPSQALEDALSRSSEDIALFVDALENAFILEQQ